MNRYFEIPLLILKYKKLNKSAKEPSRAHDTDAGYDLYSTEEVIIPAGDRAMVSTGISLSIPIGHVGLIWDRSSMGVKGVKVMGGVIDSGYNGEVKVILSNLSKKDLRIDHGQKIAQLLLQEVKSPTLKLVEEVEETTRGNKGFGSSGV